MRTLRWLGAAALLLLVAAPEVLAAPRYSWSASRPMPPRRAAANIDNSGRMNVNQLDMVVTNHGSIAYDLLTGNAGLIYPKGSTKTAVFAAGVWIGAKVAGERRVAVGEYSQEFTPGPMAGGTFQPDQPSFKNFRFTRSNPLSGTDLIEYRAQGGPTDSLDDPVLFGDATIWSVFNDADPGVHTNDAGSTAPLGIEVQQTAFAFQRAGALGNVIFIKWKLLNKGANTLDSTYVSVWSDPDLGGATDDLVGCDTTLSLGYCYNATNQDQLYGTSPPAVGYDFFQGPLVPDGLGGFKRLGMTSFNKYINGTDPNSDTQTYNYMQGLKPDGGPVHVNDDPAQPITTFQVPGNPVTGTGWLDTNPADRRLMLSSGPFTMAPGDSQEVVTAVIIGQGSDRLSSISDLKSKDAAAQTVFDLNFDICPPPPAPTVYAQPLDRGVRLIWGSEPVGDVCTNVPLNQQFNFEGIRVWQLSSNSADAQPTVVATYDIADGVTSIFSDEFNSSSGSIERLLKVAGSDNGISNQIDITTDRIRGGNLINNKDYFFAVTAFSYDVINQSSYPQGGGIVSEVLESARTPIRIAPRSSSAIFSVGGDPVSTGPLNLGGSVDANQVIQGDITGDLYRVTFDDLERWTLTNMTTSQLLLADQTNIDGGFDSPVTEGFITRVTAPRGVVTFGELKADSTLTDMTGNGPDTTGTWHLNDFGDLDVYSFIGNPTNHDYEIRVLPDTTQYAWTYGSGEVSFVQTYKCPFEVWDLGFNSLSDPSDDVKVSYMARDRDLDGKWSWKDRLYIRDIPYADVDWDTTAGAPNPNTKTTDYVPDGSDQTYGPWEFRLDDTNYTGDFPAPTTIRIISRRFTSADAYEFRTQKVGSAAGSVVGRSLKQVLAVPNPYYAHSQYELTQFDRVMKFTNIPASKKVTLRIFNIAGDLVRTIRREPTTADEMAVATMEWNLNTERNLPVASGVYIWRLDVDGVGSKTDRLAVFIEKERLDNF